MVVSSFAKYGKIGEYWANQDDLLSVIRRYAMSVNAAQAPQVKR